MSFGLFTGLLVAGLASLSSINAQSTNVTTCTNSAYTNLRNSLGQNACLMAAYARGVCVGGGFTMNSIEPFHHYVPNDPNPCECSELVYSLVSVCGLCQGRIIITWDEWAKACTTAYRGFPQAVPQGTRFPDWAYLDVANFPTNNFSLASAQAVTGLPESTPIPQSLVTGTPSSAGSSGSTRIGGGLTTSSNGASGPTDAPSSGGGGGGSNAGAIAGGVVGGLVGLALIAGLITFFILRKRRAASPAASGANGFNDNGYNGNGQGYENPNQSPFASEHPAMSQYGSNQPSMKPYDPSDPTTFPNPAPSPTINTTNPPASFNGQPVRPGGYSGVAEL